LTSNLKVNNIWKLLQLKYIYIIYHTLALNVKQEYNYELCLYRYVIYLNVLQPETVGLAPLTRAQDCVPEGHKVCGAL